MSSITVTKQARLASTSFGFMQSAEAYEKVEIRGLYQVIVDGVELNLTGAPSRFPDVEQRVTVSDADVSKYVELKRAANGDVTLLIVSRTQDPVGVDDYTGVRETVATVQESDLPSYQVWPTGETQAPQTITSQHNGNILPLTYAEKQHRAVGALADWRRKKREWMLEAHALADLNAQVPVKVGNRLRAQDAALQNEFQNPDVDPLIVAKMAYEAVKGPADYVDDRLLISSIYKADDPTNATLWVTKGNPNLEEVNRVNLSASIDYGANTLKSDYDSIDESWIKDNQDGKVDLDSETATVGTAITASVTDPDGGVKNETYQWQAKGSADTDYSAITGATSAAYTPVTGDVGKTLRCVASYNDNHSDGQTATSDETKAVVASA